MASSNLTEYEKFVNKSIWLIAGSQIAPSGPKGNGNERVLHTP